MKKFLYLIFAAIVFLSGCTKGQPERITGTSSPQIPPVTAQPAPTVIETPKQAVRNALDALKAGDAQKADMYFKYTDVVKENGQNEPLYSPFESFTYQIISVKAENDIADVKVKFTNKDFKRILSLTMDAVYRIIAKPENAKLSEKKRSEIVRRTFKKVLKTNKKTVTKEAVIRLAKNGGSWSLDMNQSVIDALCGDPDSAKL